MTFKYKDNTLVVFKNYKTLCKNKSNYQLKIIYTDKKQEYIKKFDHYFKKTDITYIITTLYLFKQNKKAKKVNYTIMSLI